MVGSAHVHVLVGPERGRVGLPPERKWGDLKRPALSSAPTKPFSGRPAHGAACPSGQPVVRAARPQGRLPAGLPPRGAACPEARPPVGPPT
eukprot:14532461-Alexandrium_andersonii.AAC.1